MPIRAANDATFSALLQMKHETANHFKKQSEYNKRRWQELFQKQEDGVARFGAQVRAAGNARNSATAAAMAKWTVRMGPTADDSGPVWQEKLNMQALANWADNERLHLSVGFGNQRTRMEEEWATFREQVDTDYNTQKAALLGKQHQLTSGAPSSPSRKWKEKEKQDMLIHTAPIITPEITPAARSGRNRDNSCQQELQQLEENYAHTNSVM